MTKPAMEPPPVGALVYYRHSQNYRLLDRASGRVTATDQFRSWLGNPLARSKRPRKVGGPVSNWNGRTIDMALDWCCMRKLGTEVEEVCLRCGFSCKGHIEDVVNQRLLHICNPVARQPIPEWALEGRKTDRRDS